MNNRYLRGLARRLLGLVIVLWGLLTLQFFLIRLTGNPAEVIAGPNPPPGELGIITRELGLNRPLAEQYWSFLTSALRLNFGTSFQSGQPAFHMVMQALPASLELASLAVLLAAVVGVLAGVFGATHRGQVGDRVVVTGSLVGQSVPSFVIGILLILLFSNTFRLLPSVGKSGPLSFIMPVVTLAAFMIARQARLVRSLMSDELARDYVRSGLANGMRPWRVRYVLAVRNIVTPVLGLSAIDLGAFLGGAVVVESVFAWPGLGSLLVSSVSARDYPVVQAAIFVIAILVVVIHEGIQVVIRITDPRERLHTARKGS